MTRTSNAGSSLAVRVGVTDMSNSSQNLADLRGGSLNASIFRPVRRAVFLPAPAKVPRGRNNSGRAAADRNSGQRSKNGGEQDRADASDNPRTMTRTGATRLIATLKAIRTACTEISVSDSSRTGPLLHVGRPIYPARVGFALAVRPDFASSHHCCCELGRRAESCYSALTGCGRPQIGFSRFRQYPQSPFRRAVRLKRAW